MGRIKLESWRSAYAVLLPADYLVSFSYDEREMDWRELLTETQDWVLVAETDEGQLVGYACVREDSTNGGPYPAELTSLHLLPAFRGQALGRELFDAVVARLRAGGLAGLWLWVLEGNRARSFYERLGGVLTGRQRKDIGGQGMVEVSYVWTF
jgi:ribosomal protein S18 acetylase RimI-like enzyme